MKTTAVLVLLLLAGFLFRIFLIPVARHGDMNNNTSWGQLLLTRGPHDFYENKDWTYSAPNQPPLYLFVFGTTALIQNSINSSIHWANNAIAVFPSKVIWWFDQWGELYIAKLPGIFADTLIGFIIYTLIKGKRGLLLAGVWLLNPISWYNSAIWGGTDSIVNLLGLLSILFLYKKRLTSSSLFFSLSVLFKGSLILFIPFWIIAALRQKFTLKQWTSAVFVSIIAFLLCTLPFHTQIDVPIWFYNLYTQRFLPGEIGSLTANAFNMWWLVNPGQVLDNTQFFGIPAREIGIGITLLLSLPLAFVVYKKPLKQKQWLSYALLSFISFLFMTRIHERYLYPFFPLATIALAFYPWLWLPYLLVSLLHVFNLYNLFWAPGIPAVQLWYLNPLFPEILSLLNIVLFGYIFVRFLLSGKSETRGK